MALNESQRKNLSKLDVMEGTGIFSNNTKVNSVDQPTIIISLGGLGAKTLNQLKGAIKRRVNKENNRIRLLAIDSSIADLDDVTDEKGVGNLTKDEVLSLYDPAVQTMGVPPFIREWLHPKHTPILRGEGCGAIRQNGRYLLAVPAVYQKVRAKLQNVINSARVGCIGRVNIIFVAGISGGTGSGTFIDMAYLTRDVMANEIGLQPREYKMSAYLYTPDVQFGCGADNNALKSNGYAALKELDYFLNLDKVDGKYIWPFTEGEIKNSTSNIYDFCTLVSSYADTGVVAGQHTAAAMNVMVESLMAIITDAELTNDQNQPEQILSSVTDNYDQNVKMWRINGNGQDHETYPLSANYSYNVIGYGSARIPVDAIMSYIALKMYENMLDEYHNMNNLNADYISRLMASVGAGDMDTIINAVKDHSQCSYSPAELPSGGDIHGVKNTYKTWRDRAIEHYITYKNTQPFSKAIDKVTASIISAFETKLNTTFGEQGPYFVSKSITASFAGDGVDGILRKIDALIKTMGEEYDDRIERCNTKDRLIAALDQKAADVPAILGIVKQEDRDSYLYMAKATIEKFTIEMEILERMQEKLIEVRNYLVDSNNKVFDVYTHVLDHIKGILAKNSDLVVNSSRTTKTGGGETYSLDVVNLDAAQENGRKLKACLDSFLTPEFLAKFKDAFEDLLRAPENRPAFTDTTDKFDATKLIQKLFDELLGKFYQEAVERFLIAYYHPSSDINNMTQLDAVMNNSAEKDKALSIAAEAICKQLQNSAKPLCKIINGDLSGFAVPNKYICVPSILKSVFEQHVKTYFGDIKICKRDNAFSIDVVTNHIGVPLAKIHGMNEADVAYDNAVASDTSHGLHMDESEGSDFTMLPAPFIREAWGWVGDHRSNTELNNVARVEKLSKKMLDYGLIAYDTEVNGTNNTRVKVYFEDKLSDALLQAFAGKVEYEVNPSTDNAEYIQAFLAANNISVKSLPIAMNNDDGVKSSIENINIIIRKNIVLYRKLNAFIKEYEALNKIVNEKKDKFGGEVIFNNTITAFTNLIKTNLITLNPAIRCWNYFDGVMEKPLYNYAMKGPFELAYNLFFAYAEYVLKIDDRMKESLNSLVMQRFNNQQVNFIMPEMIKAEIDKLFAPGNPSTTSYLLDVEMNRVNVNQAASALVQEFSIPFPTHKDNFEVLMKFYNAIRANFN